MLSATCFCDCVSETFLCARDVTIHSVKALRAGPVSDFPLGPQCQTCHRVGVQPVECGEEGLAVGTVETQACAGFAHLTFLPSSSPHSEPCSSSSPLPFPSSPTLRLTPHHRACPEQELCCGSGTAVPVASAPGGRGVGGGGCFPQDSTCWHLCL